MSEIPYHPFETFILRSPCFPTSFLNPLISGSLTTEEDLKAVCADPLIQEALFIASPSLHQRFQDWLRGEIKSAKRVEDMKCALMRYLLRMATRPTPFGVFAGLSVGRWSDENRIDLTGRDGYRRHTRFDMNYLCALVDDLSRHPVVRKSLKYFTNTSLYRTGGQFRYVEYRYQKTRRTHFIVGVEDTVYLRKALRRAYRGATIGELVACLEDQDVTAEEADAYVGELIDGQVLVSDLDPSVTGLEFLDRILARLESLDGIEEIRTTLETARQDMRRIDEGMIGTTIGLYQKIAQDIKALKTEYEAKYLFQTDMVKPDIVCSLDRTMIGDILDGVEILNKLTPAFSPANLNKFMNDFSERWETREVPLLQALDTECGIGYAQGETAGDHAPLVDDVTFPSGARAGGREIKWDAAQSLLHKKLDEALHDDLFEAVFTEKDFEALKARWTDLPDTLYSVVEIIDGGGNGSPDRKIRISGINGSSAGNMLGRFCHCDPRIENFVKEVAGKEEELNPGAVLAEIAHLPQSRIGNVVLRPVLRKFEIPYLAQSSVAEEFQIRPDDLWISVKQNRIVLRSRRLNKEVIPRLTNAHNYSNDALPVYQFLADLQTQSLRKGAYFGWGALSDEYDFLPRAVYKNLIFAPARWKIKAAEIKEFFSIPDDRQLIEALSAWRNKKKMPPRVMLEDGDNKLFLDLNNALCIRTLFSEVKKRSGFTLVEFLFDSDHAPVRSAEGAFTNEFVIAFFREKSIAEMTAVKGQEEDKDLEEAEEPAPQDAEDDRDDDE